MSISDLPVLRAIREKMRFHEHRQSVLADNVANADTPGYAGRDLVTPDFFRVAAEGKPSGLLPVATDRQHLPGHAISNRGHFRDGKSADFEISPDGNAVVLEEQMMKVTDNQMDYQVAASLYQRGLGLLKTAVGKG